MKCIAENNEDRRYEFTVEMRYVHQWTETEKQNLEMCRKTKMPMN